METLKRDFTIVIMTHSMQQARRISDLTAFFPIVELVEHDETEHIFMNPIDHRALSYVNGVVG